MIQVFYYDNGLKEGSFEKINSLKKFPLWIDINDLTKEEAEVLQKEFNLHPLTTEDFINTGIRIKVEEFPDYLFCVFYGIRHEKEISLVELDSVLGKNFLITNHKIKLEPIESLKKNKAKVESLLAKGTDFLFHKIIDEEVDNFFPVLEEIEQKIEAIEDSAIKKPTPHILSRITHTKRKVVMIKKVTFSQREKLSFLAKNNYQYLSKKVIPYIRDVYDHAVRVSDLVDNLRESISNTFDVYMSTISNNMNEVMKVLSIIATIALPLTVISGIYGTNFTTLPGSTFQYGFWAMILVMILMGFSMLYFFRRRNWF